MNSTSTHRTYRLSRRELLRTSGAIVVAFGMPPLLGAAQGAPAPGSAAGGAAGIDAWLAIARDGTATVFTDKVELGMGVSTAFAQIVAEELDLPVRSVSVVMGDTARTPDQRGVGGSTSISAGAVPVRQAAAEGRRMLLELASARLGAPVDRLTVRDGVVRVADDPARRASYGELIGGRRFDVTLRGLGGTAADAVAAAKPKAPADYKIVGTSVPRIDIPAKAAGRFAYVVDVRVPGILHGRVLRPPVPEAKLVRAGGVPEGAGGVVKVVARNNFVGVVAETEWQAIQAARSLAVTWSTSEARWPAMADLYAAMWAMTPTTRRVAEETGDVETGLASAARTIEARYEWPFQSHAMMGPACAVADVRPGAATIWSSTQHPHQLQAGIAELLGLPVERVHVIWVQGSGSYGRAGGDDAAGDAAILSQAAGRPVRVQWMRADETGWDPKGPAVVMAVRAGLDAHGGVTAWDYTARGFSGSGTPASPSTAGDLLAGQLMGRAAGGVDVPPPLQENYAFPAKRRVGEVIPWPQEGSPLRTSNLRAPSQPATTFGSESFVDEVAAAAGVDPVEFRLRYLREARHVAVIRAAAEKAGWTSRPSPRRDAPRAGLATGRGIAHTPRNNTVLATVAEVEVNQSTGDVRVTRLVIAHDCGLIINPDGLRGTIEANLIQSMSRALKEEVRFDRSGVTSVDWHSYPVLMAPDAPDTIEIVLLNHPELPPYGAGEPASVATAPAIANAIFDATGARVRTVPFTPERVKAALARRTS
ncbi:MAG TPA: molybdopterin cofactor-binding domain-containing protein [bacterium]|nr:molybdopterin cofactor-binding domain-containing protein [bacterium]